MKIIFGGETKRVPESIVQFDQLLEYSSKIFNTNESSVKAGGLKLFYMDDEGDVISVTCQSDLDQAIQAMAAKVKLIFAQNEDEARQSLVRFSVATSETYFRAETMRPAHGSTTIMDRTDISSVVPVDADLTMQTSASSRGALAGLFSFETFIQSRVDALLKQMEVQALHPQLPEPSPQATAIQLAAAAPTGPYPTALHYTETPCPVGDQSLSVLSSQSATDIEAMVDQMEDWQQQEATEGEQVTAAGPQDVNTSTGETPEGEKKEETATGETAEEQTPDQTVIPFSFAKQYLFWAKLPFLSKALAAQSSHEDAETEVAEEAEEVEEVKQVEPRALLWLGDEGELNYMARCTQQQVHGIEVGGCNYIAEWTFENNGKVAWPKDLKFIRVRGDDVEFKVTEWALTVEGPGLVETLNLVLDFKVPLNPGSYNVTLGLVHGFDGSFQLGEEVTLALTSKASLYDTLSPGQFCLDRFFNFAAVTPESEAVENPYAYLTEKEDPEEAEQDSSSEAQLNLSNDSWLFVEDDFEATPVGDQIVQYEEAEVCETPDNIVKVTQTQQDFDDEMRIFAYNQKVFMTKYDRMFKDNLVALMNEGFLDFDQNLQVLQRNCNRIEPAVSQLLELMD